MFNSRRQAVYRFLKEKKIYHNSCIKNYMESRGCNPTVSFIDNSMGWGNTIEGHSYWLKMQCEFVLFVINNKIEKLFDEEVVKRYFYKLITEGYFCREGLTKESDYYNNFKRKYNEIYDNNI